MSIGNFKIISVLEKIFVWGRGGGFRALVQKTAEEVMPRISQPLRMPLDGPDGKRAVDHSLDDAVICPLDGQKLRGGVIHRLVVGAVDKLQRGRKGGRDAFQAVKPVGAAYLAVVRDILNQCAAKIDIEQLHPPADPQDGFPGGKKPLDQLQFFLISLRLQVAGGGVFLSVPPGFDVPATGEQKRAAILRGVCGDRGACAAKCAVVVGKAAGIAGKINAFHGSLLP